MDITLSGDQINSLIGSKTKVVSLTSNLRELYNAIRDRRNSKFLIHYQTKHKGNCKGGHWCALRITPRIKEIWFFDSYGEFPDDQLESIDYNYRRATGQEDRKLGEFLYRCSKSGWKVRYNEYQYQADKPGVNTCGRWVALWLDSRLSPEAFHDRMYYLLRFTRLSPDMIAVIATQDLLR